MHPVTVISGSSACRRTSIPFLTDTSFKGDIRFGYPHTHMCVCVIEWSKRGVAAAGQVGIGARWAFAFNATSAASSFWLEWHPPRPVHNVWRIHCVRAMERTVFDFDGRKFSKRCTLRNSFSWWKDGCQRDGLYKEKQEFDGVIFHIYCCFQQKLKIIRFFQ